MTRPKTKTFLNSEIFARAYIAKQASDLSLLCEAQMSEVYADYGIKIPVYASSTLHCLSLLENTSLADLAKALNATHQVTTQRVKKLEQLGLLKRNQDPNDVRRIILILTHEGIEEAKKLKECMDAAALAYQDLSAQIGADLSQTIGTATRALVRQPLSERLPAREVVC